MHWVHLHERFLKMSEIIIGGSNCVVMLENPSKRPFKGVLVNDPCSCGSLNYFPIDELGKVKLRAWELCSISGGFLMDVAKRTRGGESSEDFLRL